MMKEGNLPHPCLQLQIFFLVLHPWSALLQKGHIQADTTPGKANQVYLYELQQQRNSDFSLPKPIFQWQPLNIPGRSSLSDSPILCAEDVAKFLLLISPRCLEYSSLFFKESTALGSLGSSTCLFTSHFWLSSQNHRIFRVGRDPLHSPNPIPSGETTQSEPGCPKVMAKLSLEK